MSTIKDIFNSLVFIATLITPIIAMSCCYIEGDEYHQLHKELVTAMIACVFYSAAIKNNKDK